MTTSGGTSISAWHFVTPDQDVHPGLVTRIAGDPVPGQWGLHASVHAAEALFWAPGLRVCRVLLGGILARADRKFAASERTVLWAADATDVVWTWGVRCATRALAREEAAGRTPAPALRNAIQARQLWLAHRTRADVAILAARGPARAALRYVCGQDSRGKPAGRAKLPDHAQLAARLCFHLVAAGSHPWRSLAARPAGWERTEIGQLEADNLDAMLETLTPKVARA